MHGADLRSRDRVVKRSEKDGLYSAMDISAIWLERAGWGCICLGINAGRRTVNAPVGGYYYFRTPYIILMQVKETKKEKDLEVATKVSVELQRTGG